MKDEKASPAPAKKKSKKKGQYASFFSHFIGSEYPQGDALYGSKYMPTQMLLLIAAYSMQLI